MSIRFRRFLYFFLLLLFAIVAPTLVLYTSGYRMDWNTRRLYKTGLLLVEYLPKDATFSIDGEVYDMRSPAHINGLSPRSYLLRVSKEGYTPWEKRLWIPEGITTFLKHIILFQTPTIAHTEPIDMMTTAFGATRLPLVAFISSSHATSTIALNDPEKTRFLQYQRKEGAQHFLWSPHNERLLLTEQQTSGGTNGMIIDPSRGTDDPRVVQSLDDITPLPLTNITWDLGRDDLLYAYTREGDASWLLALNIQKQTFERTLIPDESFGLSYEGGENRLALLVPETPEKTSVVLRAFAPEKESLERRVTLEGNATDLSFLGKHQHLLTVLDKNKKMLYLIERAPRGESPITEVFSNVNDAAWSPNEQRLIWWNEYEVWLWDLQQNIKERLTRTKDVLHNVLWYPSSEYIFLQTETSVTVLELDGRDRRNEFEFTSADAIQNIGVNQEGTWLWMIATRDGKKNIEWYAL